MQTSEISAFSYIVHLVICLFYEGKISVLYHGWIANFYKRHYEIKQTKVKINSSIVNNRYDLQDIRNHQKENIRWIILLNTTRIIDSFFA